MQRFVKNTSLSLFFLALLLLSLVFLAIVGHDLYNDDEATHAQLNGEAPQLISFGRYLFTSHFGHAVMENWQSEYLQFSLMILATVWFIQRGSTESKEPSKAGAEGDQAQKIGAHAQQNSPRWAKARGIKLWIYSNSLVLVMGLIFFLSWFAQSMTGWSEFNVEAAEHGEATLSWLGYVGSSQFWFETLQNWQSEFLAVGSMAVFSIYLRQRGSPESKPVGTPHTATGVEG
jgi:hypothetical protein